MLAYELVINMLTYELATINFCALAEKAAKHHFHAQVVDVACNASIRRLLANKVHTCKCKGPRFKNEISGVQESE